MTTPTNPSPMAKTEQEGAITFRTPSGHTATLVSVYDSPVENTDATAADLIAALQANPQLRASVLSAIPGIVVLDEADFHASIKRDLDAFSAQAERTEKAESELARLGRELQAAEAELLHTREAAELLRDSCADGDLAFRLRLEQWASRDQKRAATTEEQAAPAAVELPGGKGPDYVTRAGLAAALRKLAMCRDADTAPRHIAWQNLANELEAK